MNLSLLRQSIRSLAEPSFSRSGGPGGQNVNKVNTKVTLRLRLDGLANPPNGQPGLSETELERVKLILANRISTEGELVIISDEERFQRVNLERAYFRMEELIIVAAKIPKKRKPTKPSKAAREKRLQAKKRQGRKKAERTERTRFE